MKKITVLLVGAMLMMAAGSANALTIQNGSFETGNFAGWTVFGPGNTAVVGSATAYDSTVYNPTDGNYMAQFDATSGAIQNQISWNAGDWISFKWAFLAEDYLPYNDYSLFTLTQNGPSGQLANLTLADVNAVGNFGDTGWQTYGYKFASAGQGWIMFNSVNALDEGLSSTLLVDQVSSAPVPEPGTLLLLGSGLIGAAAWGWRRKKC